MRILMVFVAWVALSGLAYAALGHTPAQKWVSAAALLLAVVAVRGVKVRTR